ncbi:High-affinity Na(+)/H(+) antiporter NhaS3 [Cercospora beticola]|uniref:High-affinity Na(+)/H(+) antiporter NhaS3 n=1 Tax=Cercospora beticola TaxID=122368 RepID=A0A2G5HJB6_CERBT|nr:High-affinity Na(+)/H(+) antiporter NhaS3 [Cercospora beticola]PIA92651.1 High-affinity Na(+)/H(+) antiporter NhaS3 [Cercospora beticola]WPB01721.1 hypothetical protein RHO25_006352 [Cercospora beticola]CAK1363462.1 unnamed protein product [Cercospora beticola]
MAQEAAYSASLPYHEPGIVTILIISSFLLLLNCVNWLLDRLVFCGLIGQIFIGIAWGAPGSKWLTTELQEVIVQLGYLGLLCIVYEGGISSNIRALKANLFLSSAVALTGLAAPIGLSFVLLGLLPGTSPVQAFAAGAALCSTSLGTTFTVLATSGLTESRLGVVLTSAAMMDDVVGLVMVQIISSLGEGSTFSEVTVIRPVFVSIAFALLIPMLCLFVAKPVLLHARTFLARPENGKYQEVLCCQKAAFVYQTGVLLAMITGATYAGTSNLFAAYLAGASVTWLCDQLEEEDNKIANRTEHAGDLDRSNSTAASAVNHQAAHSSEDGCSGKEVYEKFYMHAVDHILRPFFFASIGFAIPITRLFTGSVVWRGIVYTILMIFAKVICGAWLIRFGSMPRAKGVSNKLNSISSTLGKCFGIVKSDKQTKRSQPLTEPIPANARPRPESAVLRQPSNATATAEASTEITASTPVALANTPRKRASLPKPKSLYPSSILGMAMVSRGEIGFLISSVAESRGVFGAESQNSTFLIVTWAILLCTLIGPITVGLLVKRVRRLQKAERQKARGHGQKEDPLGVWGIVPQTSTGGGVVR